MRQLYQQSIFGCAQSTEDKTKELDDSLRDSCFLLMFLLVRLKNGALSDVGEFSVLTIDVLNRLSQLMTTIYLKNNNPNNPIPRMAKLTKASVGFFTREYLFCSFDLYKTNDSVCVTFPTMPVAQQFYRKYQKAIAKQQSDLANKQSNNVMRCLFWWNYKDIQLPPFDEDILPGRVTIQFKLNSSLTKTSLKESSLEPYTYEYFSQQNPHLRLSPVKDIPPIRLLDCFPGDSSGCQLM